ncbi:type II toxin-antitoxin system MqsA family antitoxin [Methanocalculus sp.]|uniref:type II toxin-antitoxin system MqsA family antitoxin n=1 Tax=Methanocalculus sp. TaxID=2004547 RepID=UPI0026148296|nr:type II toxin-antitoxin system MqsA family antitoxin [Methanocalculus sp.]MDG6251044.1 type II toxin-antitoxin system MqsA family antitoxin [Methanocalculus sp.]
MKCALCKSGETRHGMTTITFEREGFTLVVKEVPAEICMNCGEDYVDETITHEIMALAERIKRKWHPYRCPQVCSRFCNLLRAL